MAFLMVSTFYGITSSFQEIPGIGRRNRIAQMVVAGWTESISMPFPQRAAELGCRLSMHIYSNVSPIIATRAYFKESMNRIADSL